MSSSSSTASPTVNSKNGKNSKQSIPKGSSSIISLDGEDLKGDLKQSLLSNDNMDSLLN